MKKDGLKYYVNLIYGIGCKSDTEIDLQARRKDNISHYILRLAYCKDKDQAKWFMNQEIELFKMRFSSLDKEGVDQFLAMHKLDCKHVCLFMFKTYPGICDINIIFFFLWTIY